MHLRRSRARRAVLMIEVAALARFAIGVILALAFCFKVRNVRGFASSLADYRLLEDERWLRAVALVVVAAEGIIAFCLLSGWLLEPALVGASVLLLLFSVVTARTIALRESVGCGCLGTKVTLRMGWLSVVANVALAAGAFVGLAETPVLAPLATDAGDASASAAFVILGSALLVAANYWLIPYARAVSEIVDEALRTHSMLELAP
jgi:hypothetical protein